LQLIDTGSYHCVIKNSCGHVLTQFVKVTVQNVPTAAFTTLGNYQDLCINDNVTLQQITGAGYTFINGISMELQLQVPMVKLI
jgi:hypothetical protein